MKTLRIWYLFCFIFAFYSLDTLVEESYEVAYEKKNETDVQFLACAELGRLYRSKTIDLKPMGENLYRYFNSSIYSHWKERFKSEFEELVLNRTKSGGYLILNKKACLIANDQEELKQICRFLQLVFSFLFAIKKETFDFVQMKTPFDTVDQLTVIKRTHPYSDCDQSNSRFFCLNECFKRKFRLARYFYSSSETGLVHRNFNENNQTIKDNESMCFNKFKKENCKMTKYTANFAESRSKNPQTETFEAYPKLSEIDYWLQLIGLICSFSGLSFREFISISVNFIQSKVRKRKVRICLFYLKWTILFLSLISFGYLCIRTVLDQNKAETERGTSRILTQPKFVRLAICVDIGGYFHYLFEDKTMLKIERLTDGALNETLESILVIYSKKSFQLNYEVHSNVLFYNDKRCFTLFIRPEYQAVSLNPKLRFNFKETVFNPDIYLLGENENLNDKSFFYTGRFAFTKRIVKRLRSGGKCVDYEEKYRSKYANCTSRWNCIDWCINRKFIEKYNRTAFGIGNPWMQSSIGSVINKDSFSSAEWSSTHLLTIPEVNPGINNDIEAECLEEIPDEKPCLIIEFQPAVEISSFLPESTEEIDLQFEVVWLAEESVSSYKLALDLVSIQSIFFGLTVFGSLKMFCSFVQRKTKIVLFFVYLVCSIGFSWHTYHIFKLLISSELVPTYYYELAREVQMPEMAFCLQIDKEKIDQNHQLTGEYLEELTVNLTPERIFKNITYLNESNKWIPFDLNRVERFFFLDLKCFRIKIDHVYARNQFHFSPEQVLKVNFSRMPNEDKKYISFMTKSEETAKFSRIVYLAYGWLDKLNYWNPKNFVTNVISIDEYEDRFSFIRQYFFTNPEEDLNDLDGLLADLQSNKFNLRTLNFAIETNEFGLEVDEGLFDQLYLVRKNQNKRTNLNYKLRFFVENHLKVIRGESFEMDFSFKLDFLHRVVASTNEENFVKLILSLLNLLIIWFDLGILDLHSYLIYLSVFLLNKILQFLLFSCKTLNKFKSWLFKLLNLDQKTFSGPS